MMSSLYTTPTQRNMNEMYSSSGSSGVTVNANGRVDRTVSTVSMDSSGYRTSSAGQSSRNGSIQVVKPNFVSTPNTAQRTNNTTLATSVPREITIDRPTTSVKTIAANQPLLTANEPPFMSREVQRSKSPPPRPAPSVPLPVRSMSPRNVNSNISNAKNAARYASSDRLPSAPWHPPLPPPPMGGQGATGRLTPQDPKASTGSLQGQSQLTLQQVYGVSPLGTSLTSPRAPLGDSDSRFVQEIGYLC